MIASVALAIVAPTALNSVRLDRLLARTDNRVIASREVYRVVRGIIGQSGADRRLPCSMDTGGRSTWWPTTW
jgi:hypothetical protein